MNQETLLKIVKNWDLNEKPEYRGFRCANCQKHIRKAWHHWLTTRDYKTPVHFCKRCETAFRSSRTVISKPKIEFNKKTFGLKFPKESEAKIQKIIGKWRPNIKSKYKPFVCDECNIKIYKAYHVWYNMNKTLVEIHFCKKCGNKLGLDSK